MRRWLYSFSSGFVGVIILLMVWWGTGWLLVNFSHNGQFRDFLPIPALKAMGRLVEDPVFWSSVKVSLARVGIGLMMAFIFGFSSGIVLGISRQIRRFTTLPMQFVRMISPLSWMPIAILFFPSFEYAIYFLILMASVWPIIHNTSQGIQLLVKVLLPFTLPYMLTGLRLALGIAWIILVPAEYLGINSGLGYLINDARDTMEYDRLMALVISIGILGFCLDSIFRFLTQYFNWRKK